MTMNLNELLFFSCFLVFVIGMLLVDLGIFSKDNHAIKTKEAIIWTSVWVFFSIVFYLLLMFHGELVHGKCDPKDLQAMIMKYEHPFSITGLSADKALSVFNHNMASEYITGYIVEYSLSVDNVFVMILIFTAFGVEKRYYKRVLFWGILGAIIMRFLFIFLSSALIARFGWIMYVFGGFLVFTGIEMFVNRNRKKKIEPDKHPVMKYASRYFRVSSRSYGGNFKVKLDGKWFITPLFVVLLIIEFSDVIFAVDSVPAVFAITRDPYIVFFSNIFAIMGLRSLFFLVQGIMDRFHYIKEGLSVLLVFIGAKMLLHHWFEHIGFTTNMSLLVILLILLTSIAASVIFPKKHTLV